MKRPKKAGMYKFVCTEQFTFPISLNEWVIGIVFKYDGKWSFFGTAGNDKYAHHFSWPLAPFVGNGNFEFIK